VKAIGNLGLSGAAPELFELLESAPALVQAGILDVLGELGDRRHIALIEEYARSQDEVVRDAAAEALRTFVWKGRMGWCSWINRTSTGSDR